MTATPPPGHCPRIGHESGPASADDTIFVVEDCPVVLKVIARHLRTWGYAYRTIDDGAEAWNLILHQRPPMILLDWDLPGVDGLSICRRLRRIETASYVYIIMLTSKDDQSDMVAGFDAGADDYMVKPIRKEALHARIKVGWRVLNLERRVADKIAELQQRNRIITEQTEQLRTAQQRLMDTARRAGMAEIATNVLHNVGNVLNSAVTSAAVIRETVAASRVATLDRLATLLADRQDDLPDYIANDPQGRQLPPFLRRVADALLDERRHIRDKLATVGRSHEHIRQIIARQQTLAGAHAINEPVPLPELFDDAAQLLGGSLSRHRIDLRIRCEPTLPPLQIDRHKLLQILLNLLANARDALRESPPETRRILLSAQEHADRAVTIEVRDNGCGIPPENIDNLFQFGFTTKTEGHGFGLHGCANLAREMGGSLAAESQGTGHGACFRLILPKTKEASTP